MAKRPPSYSNADEVRARRRSDKVQYGIRFQDSEGKTLSYSAQIERLKKDGVPCPDCGKRMHKEGNIKSIIRHGRCVKCFKLLR